MESTILTLKCSINEQMFDCDEALLTGERGGGDGEDDLLDKKGSSSLLLSFISSISNSYIYMPWWGHVHIIVQTN